jgi:osmotically-inducible protein OsmY
MRSYNQQIEDEYTWSKRQGDLMRDRNIERSSGQDRRNRYRDDRYQFPEQHQPYDEDYMGDTGRTDRYGYERSSLYNELRQRPQHNEDRTRYPETYRSAMSGYMSEHVGDDLGRSDYNYGPHRGKGPKNYRRSDERIREEVLDKLTDDPYVDASEIEVAVEGSEVTLMGLVDERTAKRRAEDIVESVTGVKHVENRLKVQPK